MNNELQDIKIPMAEVVPAEFRNVEDQINFYDSEDDEVIYDPADTQEINQVIVEPMKTSLYDSQKWRGFNNNSGMFYAFKNGMSNIGSPQIFNTSYPEPYYMNKENTAYLVNTMKMRPPPPPRPRALLNIKNINLRYGEKAKDGDVTMEKGVKGNKRPADNQPLAPHTQVTTAFMEKYKLV